MAKKKRPMTKIEAEQTLKAMKAGETRRFKDFNMIVTKPRKKRRTFEVPSPLLRAKTVGRRKKR